MTRDSIPTGWTHGFCKANGIDVHYSRTGGDKPALILLHGLMGAGACWTPIARSLESRFDVIMPDARGHGRSSAPFKGYRYEDLADDVLGLISSLDLKTPFVLGHSMGGMSAAVLASRPGVTLRGVVLADPTFITPQWQREVYESDLIEQHRKFLGTQRADLLAASRLRHADRSQEIIELVTDARLQTRVCAFDILTPPNPDFRQLIRSIRAPVLLVLGSRGVVSVETAHELREINAYVSFKVMRDAGHGLPHDRPEAFAQLVMTFLLSTLSGTGELAQCSSDPRSTQTPEAA